MTSGDCFYAALEEGVREAVRALRNAGINTICSCHHEGFIQTESTDPYNEQNTIFNVMHELGINEWTATLRVEHTPAYYFHHWEIKSGRFKQDGGV